MFSIICIFFINLVFICSQDIIENSSIQQILKPIFVKMPPEHLYVTPSKAVMIECVVKQSSFLQINCVEDQDTISKTSTASLLDQSKETVYLKPNKKSDKKQFDKITKSVQGDVHSVNLTLTEKTVESWFVRNFWCQCEAAYTQDSSTSNQLVRTKKTFIEVAYIDKTFKLEPNSATLYLGRYVKLTCIPPDGSPKPKIHWRKNGRKLELTDLSKILVSDDGSLVIFSTSITDNGQYECVAENEAGIRISKAAKLEVLDTDSTENGDWLPWAPWNACPNDCTYGKYCVDSCIKYLRRRSRLCKTSSKDRVKCPGSSLQTESCATFCRVDGEWSTWSGWSLCQPDCTRKRIRECNNPKPQSGGDQCLPKNSFSEKENCTLDSCFRIDTPNPQNRYVLRDMVVYVVLSIALFLLILVTTIILCFQKKHFLFSTQSNEINSKIGGDKGGFILLKSLGNKNAIVKDNNSESVTTYNSGSGNNSSPLINEANMKHDSSNSTICTSRFVDNLSTVDVTLKNTPASKQVSFQHPPISCHYKEVELPTSPILANYPSLIYQPISTPISLPPIIENRNLISNGSGSNLLISNSGGRVILGSTGISVTVMPDTFGSEKTISMELYSKHTHERLIEFSKYTQLSSIIFCSLKETISLQKPLILVFPHCVTWKSFSSWDMKVVKMNNNFKWEVYIDFQNPQMSNKQAYCHLDEEFCYLMTFELFPFCLLGKSQNPLSYDNKDNFDLSNQFPLPVFLADKRLCVISFLEPLHQQKQLQLSCYLFIDTKDIKDYLISKITAAGCRIFDIPHILSLKESAANVSVTVESASTSWKVHAKHRYQEILFEDLWNFRTEPFITRNIILEHSETIFQPFIGHITVYQNNFYQDRIEISVSFNSTEISNTLNKSSTPSSTYKDATCKLIPASKTFRLPRVTIRELSIHLDPPKIPVSQWSMIAKQLGISNNLEYFHRQSNPTAYLLMLWEAQNREETALVDLKSTLKIIGLLDIANVFK